jgi:hypothetical protein
MHLSLTMDTDILLLSTGVAAGQTTQTPTGIETKDGQSATIIAHIGTIASTGVCTVVPQYSIDGGSNYTDVTADTITYADTDDNKLAIVEFTVIPRTVTHVRLKITRATADVTIVNVIGVRRKGRGAYPVGATGAKSANSTVKDIKRVTLNP